MSTITVQALWVDGALSTLERLTVLSHLRQGHRFHLYTYGTIPNVPAGAEVRDAREILPAQEGAWQYQKGHGAGSFAAGSNAFRYKLLWMKGGWWVDMDLVALRPFDLAQEYVIATEADHKTWLPTTCCLKVPARSPLMRRCLSETRRYPRDAVQVGMLGPRLLARQVHALQLDRFCVPPRYFWPKGTYNSTIFIHPERAFNTDLCYGLHISGTCFAKCGCDKDAPCPTASMYESLKRLYGVTSEPIRTDSLEVVVTEQCSLACLNCPSASSLVPSSRSMTMETVDRLVREASHKSWKAIHVRGGEPTLHPAFPEVVSRLLALGPVTVHTNMATAHTRRQVRELPAGATAIDRGTTAIFQRTREALFVAPIDLDRYRTCDFSKGCWRLHEYGLAVDCDGAYHACLHGAMIDRVFHLNQGIHGLENVSEARMRQQCEQACRYCGLFKSPAPHVMGEQPISPSWQEALHG